MTSSPSVRQIVNQAAALAWRGQLPKQPSLAGLGRCYGVSRQRIHALAKQFGRPTVSDPQALFYAVANKQPIVRVLADPAERKRIAAEISKL